MTTQQPPSQRLRAHIDAGTLAPGNWTRTGDDGRTIVCMLSAMSPECGEAESSGACPTEVMPQWLAQMVPGMYDDASDKARPAMARRMADISSRWDVLGERGWQRAEWRARIAILDEAARHAGGDSAVVEVIAGVRTAYADAISTGSLDARALAAARAAARAAAWAAARDRMTTGILDAIELSIEEASNA